MTAYLERVRVAKIGAAGIVAVLISMAGGGAWAQSVEESSNRKGGSYALLPMPGAVAATCRARCESDARCVAWTFVRPAAGKPAACWLKDKPGDRVADACCVSGLAPQRTAATASPSSPGSDTTADADPYPPDAGKGGAVSQPAVPPGERRTELGNILAIDPGPTLSTVFEARTAIRILSIQTYHWNGGRGMRPGTIALQALDGRIWGPWQTVGLRGQGGVPNAYWHARVDLELPPGRYRVIDSDPPTWSTNVRAQRLGFVTLVHEGEIAFVYPSPTAPRR